MYIFPKCNNLVNFTYNYNLSHFCYLLGFFSGYYYLTIYCQAQFQLASSVELELRLALILIIFLGTKYLSTNGYYLILLVTLVNPI